MSSGATPPPLPPTGLFLDTHIGLVTGPTLVAGQVYTVTVDGTYSLWNDPLTEGAPEPNATYPTPPPRTNTQVGLDAETLFAQPAHRGHTFGHWTFFQIDTGVGFAHVEPAGGPFAHPQPGHAYTYHLTGRGAPVRFKIADTGAITDNYGALRIVIASGVTPTPTPPPPPPPPPITGQPEPPAFTPTRTLPAATTWTELQIALANLQPGDRLPCHGVIFPPEAVFNKRLTAPAEIVFDSACKANGGKGLRYPAIWFASVAYLRFMFNGMAVTNPVAGWGIQIGGASHCVFEGLDVHDCAAGAIGAIPTNAPIIGNYIRGVVRDWGLVPSLDNHAEKGTGLHGLLVETTQTAYNATGNTFVLSTPGSKVGGSLLEVGSGRSSMVPTNNQAWLQAANLLQDAKVQTAGNALNVYGYVHDLEVLNVTASGLHGFAVSSDPYSNGYQNVAVRQGTATNCCLNPRWAGHSPWMKNGGIVYSPGPFTPQP